MSYAYWEVQTNSSSLTFRNIPLLLFAAEINVWPFKHLVLELFMLTRSCQAHILCYIKNSE